MIKELYVNFLIQMDKFRSECSGIVEEVVKQLEGLNGTQHEELIGNVRICLSNGLDELSTFVESEKIVKKDGGVRVYMVGGHKAKVCQMVAYHSGDGVNAVGGIGVAWGEKVAFNMGSKVQTSVVNKRTCELWGILIACCIAEARKYARILIMTEEVSYTRKLLMNVMSGKLDGYDDCKVIVEKIKEYSGRVDVTIPDDVQTAVIRSSQENVLKECKKLAKEALKEAKNEMKTWGR